MKKSWLVSIWLFSIILGIFVSIVSLVLILDPIFFYLGLILLAVGAVGLIKKTPSIKIPVIGNANIDFTSEEYVLLDSNSFYITFLILLFANSFLILVSVAPLLFIATVIYIYPFLYFGFKCIIRICTNSWQHIKLIPVNKKSFRNFSTAILTLLIAITISTIVGMAYADEFKGEGGIPPSLFLTSSLNFIFSLFYFLFVSRFLLFVGQSTKKDFIPEEGKKITLDLWIFPLLFSAFIVALYFILSSYL